MGLTFEWDRRKAAANLQKHGVSCEEASSVVGDPLSVTVADPDHSVREMRFVTVGRSRTGRILAVVLVERGDSLRVISARLATRREMRGYEQGA